MLSPNNEPIITVIVAAFQRAATLRFALQSIQQQDFSNFEVRVIGDACTDASESVVTSLQDSRFHWTNLPRHIGSQSGPNNEGIRQALGSYIAYLGHDDLWFPWHLSSLLAALEKESSDFVFSLCALLGPKGRKTALGPLPEKIRSMEDHFVPPLGMASQKKSPRK